MSFLATTNIWRVRMGLGSNEEKEWQEAATLLRDIGAIQFGNFKLTSGKTSPYYIDLRLAPSHPELFRRIRDLCVKALSEIDAPVDKLAGVPVAGLPLTTAVSLKLDYPLIFVRKGGRGHGGEKVVEGSLSSGERVVVIDDVATTGGSLMNAAEGIRKEGGKVEHAIVVVDREEGAREKLRAEGIALHVCMGIKEVVEYLHSIGSLGDENFSAVIEYIEENWYER